MVRSTGQSTAFSPSAAPGVLLRPRVLALVCIVALAALGWAYIGLMVGTAAETARGPGFLDLWTSGDAAGRAWLDALCRPALARAHPGIGAWRAADLALVYLMWSAMTFAMMLPTAGPMVLAYAEIAETAAAKHEAFVSPLVLTAGYVVVWLGFAAAAAALQWGLIQIAALDPTLAAAGGLFSGAIFIGAGVYQFSALKRACLTFCQRPFPYLFAHWSTEPAAVFRLGVKQGFYCLGCCWAMMLVMFAVGVMNIVWMAALGAIMAIEKIMNTTRFSRAIGVLFIAAGAVLVVSSVNGHWPVRAG